jgi:hypothetical protein
MFQPEDVSDYQYRKADGDPEDLQYYLNEATDCSLQDPAGNTAGRKIAADEDFGIDGAVHLVGRALGAKPSGLAQTSATRQRRLHYDQEAHPALLRMARGPCGIQWSERQRSD